MASSLGVSEGMAGQAVTATALVALVTGLLIATATSEPAKATIRLETICSTEKNISTQRRSILRVAVAWLNFCPPAC
jgi:hypothetical protein